MTVQLGSEQGSLFIYPSLDQQQLDYLAAFARTRHCRRDPLVCREYPDPLRENLHLPIGTDGIYCVHGARYSDPYDDPTITGDWTLDGEPNLCASEAPDFNFPFLFGRYTDDRDRPVSYMRLRSMGDNMRAPYIWAQFVVQHFLKRWSRELYGAVLYTEMETEDDFAIVGTRDRVRHVLMGRKDLE